MRVAVEAGPQPVGEPVDGRAGVDCCAAVVEVDSWGRGGGLVKSGMGCGDQGFVENVGLERSE